MQTYLFYDIETTGLNKAFDQVIQFAAIRTDLNLCELSRYELRIKLNADIIPSPYAIITHRTGIKASSKGISEFEAIKKIHQWLNEPGTISVGYNTLGFDDEFLRFSFYRNLLSCYTHQYANNCGRMDIYPMTVMYFLFKNNLLNWPQIDGKTSLKLEQLNLQNNFCKGPSHDAMADVEATVALAKCFYSDKTMWDYLINYFRKKPEQQRIEPLQKDAAIIIDGLFGSALNFSCAAICIGTHKHYKNQTLWLRLDNIDFASTPPEDLIEKTWVINKKPAEPNFVLPFKDRFIQQLTEDRIKLTQANLEWLKANPTSKAKLANHYLSYKYPVLPNTDPDASLYLHGFLTAGEELLCQQFHAFTLKDKAILIDKFSNTRLRTLALRILGRHYPEILSAANLKLFQDDRQRLLSECADTQPTDFRGQKALSPKQALADIAALQQRHLRENHLDIEQINLLNEYSEYLLQNYAPA
jgi:exodeoxyribonuclease-1